MLNMLMDYGLHVQLMVAMTDIAIRTEYIFDVVYLLILYRIVKEINNRLSLTNLAVISIVTG